MKPKKIVSGGQTGADRAALDFALANGVECAGWCPKGRIAEDGPIPAKYPLREMGSAEYPPRTRRNVEESDATVIFDAPVKKSSRGTRLTVRVCEELRRPHLVLSGFPDARSDAERLRAFLAANEVVTLNVAGNRESGSPGIHAHVLAVLTLVVG
jgi:hypothetical protein